MIFYSSVVFLIETTKIGLSGILDAAVPYVTNCVNLTNAICAVKYGEHAICRDEKCYCHRRLSVLRGNDRCGIV